MWIPLALAVFILAPDPEGLGDSDWATREQAESTFRALGPLGWPALRRATESESAEVRMRADRLLAPYRKARDDAYAYAVLWGVYPVTPAQLFGDLDLRYRVQRIALECGCPEWCVGRLFPDVTTAWTWWADGSPEESCYWGLVDCRRYSNPTN